MTRSSVGRKRDSPLRRTVDRVERGVLALAIVLAILAVPAAVLVGAAVQRAGETTAQAQLATTYPTTAILVRDAQTSDLGVATAVGEWHTQAGIVRTGTIDAPAGSVAGASVQVWLDQTGRPVDPPLTEDQAYWRGVITVIVLLIGTFILLAIGCRVARLLLDRRRLAEWEADWLAVEPRWTHRA
ncbi:MAG TPA: hypothetical protein VGN81_34030 [Pseudonocardiaceae bacterium]